MKRKARKRPLRGQERIIRRALGFERALHRWDKWLDSIAYGRKVLRFRQSPPSLQEMRSVAKNVLSELGFPDCTFFELYWLCCVFADYETKSGFYFEKLVMPDWFPFPHGFKHYDWIDLRGKRIYPPEVWDESDVMFWRERDSFAQFLHEPEKKQFLEEMVPNREWVIVLPPDHPIRKSIRRGRPITTTPNGETLLE